MPFLAGITQPRWLSVLQKCGYVGEVNFWRPSCKPIAQQHFGRPFLFVEKGRKPRRVRGVGVINRFEVLTIREAWARWGVRNGETSLENFVSSVAHALEKTKSNSGGISNTISGPDSRIGCIVIRNLVLLPRETSPSVEQVLLDFSDTIVSYKVYQGDVPPPFAHYVQVAAAEQDSEGFPSNGRDPEELQAIEQHAMKVCKATLAHYELLDVSTPQRATEHLGIPYPGYDLLVRGTNLELHVEVKGTTLSDPVVTLTHNEMETGVRDPNARLFVVSDIHTFKGEQGWEATGGVPLMLKWTNPPVLRELVRCLGELADHGLDLSRADWSVHVHRSDLLVVE